MLRESAAAARAPHSTTAQRAVVEHLGEAEVDHLVQVLEAVHVDVEEVEPGRGRMNVAPE